jgi:hypothetical protein
MRLAASGAPAAVKHRAVDLVDTVKIFPLYVNHGSDDAIAE